MPRAGGRGGRRKAGGARMTLIYTMMTDPGIGATPMLAFFGGLGHWEVLAVLVVGLLLFGKRLPDVGRSLGRSIVEFKRGVKGIQEEIDEEVDTQRRPPAEAKPAQPPSLEPAEATDAPSETEDGRRVTQGERMRSTPAGGGSA